MAALESRQRVSEIPQGSIETLAIDTIRTLAMDAVQAAQSGHPGTPMALAPVAYTLWQNYLRFDPEDPIWPNRDRFVLSVGHASMLLYAMLHLTGTKAIGTQLAQLKLYYSAQGYFCALYKFSLSKGGTSFNRHTLTVNTGPGSSAVVSV